MADIRNGFSKNSNISQVRTPMTPDNKYKRIGLLLIGLACIIAGVIIWIASANSSQNTAETETTTIETAATAE